MSSKNDQDTISRPSLAIAAAARVRLEKSTADLASEHRFVGTEDAVSEIDMLEEATALTRAAAHRK